jgi:hypothetical protein
LLKRKEMRRFLGSEKGEGKVGFLISLAILIAGIYVGYVLIPIKVKTYEFKDAMRDQARYGAVHTKRIDIVHERLMKKAKRLGIPLKPENLEIERDGGTLKDGGTFVITANYSVPIDLTVYKTKWEYRERETAPIF